jgi:hypothetical protein
LRSKGKPILEDSDRLRDKEKLILDNAKRLSGNTDRVPGKTKLESGRTESEPGKIEPSSSKEKPVLGNANQLPGNEDQLSRKADPGTELGSGKAEPGLCYRKSWNQFRVKKTIKNRLVRRVSSGTLGHL